MLLFAAFMSAASCTSDSDTPKPADASLDTHDDTDARLADTESHDTDRRDTDRRDTEVDDEDADVQEYRPAPECPDGPEGCPCDPDTDEYCCTSNLYQCYAPTSTYTLVTHSWCNNEEVDLYGYCPSLPCSGPGTCNCGEGSECCTSTRFDGVAYYYECEGAGRWHEVEDGEVCVGTEVTCPWDLPHPP